MLPHPQTKSLSRLLCVGYAVCALQLQAAPPATGKGSNPESTVVSEPESNIADLKAEIEQLKSKLLAASAMRDVDYHSQNLWFAGTAGNWPLATYYWEKIIPHLQLPSTGLTQSGSVTAQKQSKLAKDGETHIVAAIRNHDVRAFVPSYRSMLQSCYDCHKAAGKPFLRPRLPVPPAQSIITVKPNESWPQ